MKLELEPKVHSMMPSASQVPVSTQQRPMTGLNADPSFLRLLAQASRKDLSPKLGSELTNIQLASLTDEQVEDLAGFIAQRGVVFFRDQSLSEDEHVAFASKLGPLKNHVRAKGKYPSLSDVKVDEKSKTAPGETWHSDLCEEALPPSFSILYMEKTPTSGGDTLFANMYAAYDKLSPRMKHVFDGMTASNRRLKTTLKKEVVARDEVSSHPVIRTHPVTGWQMIFANAVFTTHIDGLSMQESSVLLRFLREHIEQGVEFQIRFRWEPSSVAIWDNRAVQHHAVWDYWPESRVGRRVAVEGTKPYFEPKATTQTAAFGRVPPNWQRSFEHVY